MWRPPGRYLFTYRWTDAFGADRALDLVARAVPRRELWAYPAGRAGAPVLVAAATDDGVLVWSADRLQACGLDTAAARNDLVELYRRTGLPE